MAKIRKISGILMQEAFIKIKSLKQLRRVSIRKRFCVDTAMELLMTKIWVTKVIRCWCYLEMLLLYGKAYKIIKNRGKLMNFLAIVNVNKVTVGTPTNLAQFFPGNVSKLKTLHFDRFVTNTLTSQPTFSQLRKLARIGIFSRDIKWKTVEKTAVVREGENNKSCWN